MAKEPRRINTDILAVLYTEIINFIQVSKKLSTYLNTV